MPVLADHRALYFVKEWVNWTTVLHQSSERKLQTSMLVFHHIGPILPAENLLQNNYDLKGNNTETAQVAAARKFQNINGVLYFGKIVAFGDKLINIH